MKKLTASMLVLMGGASYGLLSTIVKIAYHGNFSAAEVVGSEHLLGCLGVWIIGFPALSGLRNCSWRTILKLVSSGTFIGLTTVFYYLALQGVSASLGVILLFQYVWMGVLLDWFLQRRPPTGNRWLALLVVSIGTILAAGYQALSLARVDPLSIIFGLLAAASYAGSLSVSGRVATDVPAMLRTMLMVAGAAILTIPIFPPAFLINGSLGKGLWLWGSLLGLFGVVIPPLVFNKGMPIIGSSLGTILSAVELPTVILCAALILGEKIQILQWSGVTLILLGIIIADSQIPIPIPLTKP